MARKAKDSENGDGQVPANREDPKSLSIAERGVTTGKEFIQLHTALQADLIAGRLGYQVGNAVCNASGKMLKMVEMQYKYGRHSEGGNKDISLIAK